MDDEIIPELTPYYVGPADSSSEDSSSFYDAFEEPPPPAKVDMTRIFSCASPSNTSFIK